MFFLPRASLHRDSVSGFDSSLWSVWTLPQWTLPQWVNVMVSHKAAWIRHGWGEGLA